MKISVFTIDFWKPIEPGSRLVRVYPWEHLVQIPHPKWMHRHGLICSNCYDDPFNHMSEHELASHIEDAFDQEQREIYDLNRLLDADDPFAQERAEDLEEAIRSPLIIVWRKCASCESEFEIPEHFAAALENESIPLLCSQCRS